MQKSAALFQVPKSPFKSGDIALIILNHARTILSRLDQLLHLENPSQAAVVQAFMKLHPYQAEEGAQGSVDYLSQLILKSGECLEGSEICPELVVFCRGILFSMTSTIRRMALEASMLKNEAGIILNPQDDEFQAKQFKLETVIKNINKELNKNLGINHFDSFKKRTQELIDLHLIT